MEIGIKGKVKIAVVACTVPLLFSLLITSSMFAVFAGNQSQGNSSSTTINLGSAKVSAAVMAWEPTVEKYANQYGVTQYVPLILAVMQQESGGTVPDVMQAAEGPYNKQYAHEPNGIPDPDYSINCGVQELKECLTEAGAKDANDINGISLALQSYNFGSGFISYAKSNGGYSLGTAQAFSSMEAQKCGWSGYGDPQYVPHVLRYYSVQK